MLHIWYNSQSLYIQRLDERGLIVECTRIGFAEHGFIASLLTACREWEAVRFQKWLATKDQRHVEMFGKAGSLP